MMHAFDEAAALRDLLVLTRDRTNAGDARLATVRLARDHGDAKLIAIGARVGKGWELRTGSPPRRLGSSELALLEGASAASTPVTGTFARRRCLFVSLGDDVLVLCGTKIQEGDARFAWLELVGSSMRRCLEQERALARLAEERAATRAFVDDLSHEIRSPLAAVISAADILQRTPLDPEQRRVCAALLSASDHLLLLSESVLNDARARSGHLVMERAEFVLWDVLRRIADLHSGRARPSVEILCAVDDAVPWTLIGDRLRLEQILSNIVGNAIKFTEEGEVTLRVRRAPDAEGVLVFTVVDTGPGMPQERLEALFQRFAQGGASIARRFGGSGLGLAICRSLIDALGGTITVDTELGRGTRIEVSLPLAQSTRPAPPRARASSNITIVCDRGSSAEVAEQLAAAATTGSVRVFTSLELPAAIERGVIGRDTVLLFDSGPSLPDVDVQIARTRRAFATTGAPPILALARAGAAPHGADGVVTKPARPDELAEMVRSLEGSERDQPAAPADVVRGAPLVVLVIEDMLELRLLLSVGLRAQGLNVVFAEDGEAALRAFRLHRFDAVLVDLHVPRMDGCEILELLRAEERSIGRAPTPMIALTGDGTEEARSRTSAAGFSRHLVKPVRIEEIVRVLRELELPEPLAVTASIPDLSTITALYLSNRRRELDVVADAITKRAYGTVATIGHGLQGSGASFGFPELSSIGAELERAAKARDPDRARRACDAIARIVTAAPAAAH